jgi:hypothetical protein
MPIILAVWEAEIETIEVQDQPGKIDSISKISNIKKGWWSGSRGRAPA